VAEAKAVHEAASTGRRMAGSAGTTRSVRGAAGVAPPGTAGGRPLLVVGGTVIDETGSRRADVAVVDGQVAAVGEQLDRPTDAVVLDAGGCLVTPGLVDLHTHLREPGAEAAETVESGSRAAARGGFTAVVAMPNTVPAIDSAAVVHQLRHAASAALCEVVVAGAITVGRAGERLAPMAELAALGVRLFTDDGTGVQDGGLMRRALQYARGLGVVVAQHCEDRLLAEGGLMHEGDWSSWLGVPGVPAAAEEAMVARDLALVRETGAAMHFLHLSTAGSVALVARARASGLPVTAEVTPHHLALSDAELRHFDPVFRVNPPLRTADDVLALRRACADGVVDAVATDHAPHPPEAKESPLDVAPPGMIGLETAWPVTLGALHRGEPSRSVLRGELGSPDRGPHAAGAADGSDDPAASLPVEAVIGLLSWRPARIAGLRVDQGGSQGGPVVPGAPANLAVLDVHARVRVDPARLASRSRNTPWAGRDLTGAVRHTIFRGEAVVVDAEVQR
jgi:dihydroorotase